MRTPVILQRCFLCSHLELGVPQEQLVPVPPGLLPATLGDPQAQLFLCLRHAAVYLERLAQREEAPALARCLGELEQACLTPKFEVTAEAWPAAASVCPPLAQVTLWRYSRLFVLEVTTTAPLTMAADVMQPVSSPQPPALRLRFEPPGETGLLLYCRVCRPETADFQILGCHSSPYLHLCYFTLHPLPLYRVQSWRGEELRRPCPTS